jgi:hypothetical protein
MFISTRRIARPIVAFARQPGPNRPRPQLMRSRSTIGPLTMMSGAPACVVVWRCARPYSGSETACSAATVTGRYSGLQPAMTALTAI